MVRLFIPILLNLLLNFSFSTSVVIRKSCENPQNVFDGNVGVIFELLPVSRQKNTILQFVENQILRSKYYGLDFDGLTGRRHTLATTIPYPTTSSYNISQYGSIFNLPNVKAQVDNFNNNIKPVQANGDIIDAFLYVLSNLPAGNKPSVLIVIGNDEKMIVNNGLVDYLKESFKVFTIAIGDNPADLSPISTGQGYSFVVANGNDQIVAELVARSIESLNPGVYCPPGQLIATSTSARPTTVTTRPTVEPCQCQGRWVYSGDLAVSFEFIQNGELQSKILQFVENNLIGTSQDSYGLARDSNGNQPTKLQFLPYPDTTEYQIFPYGGVTSNDQITTIIESYQLTASTDKSPNIIDSFNYLLANPGPSTSKAIVLVAQNASQVAAAADAANSLKAKGYKIFTVNVDGSIRDGLTTLSSGDGYSFQISGFNGEMVSASIAQTLKNWSPVCFEDPTATVPPGCLSTFNPQTITTPKTISSCSAPFDGDIAVVFELISSRNDSVNVTSFIAQNLYNSANYKFEDGTTVAINVPYPGPYNYDPNILKYGDAKNYFDLRVNIAILRNLAGFDSNPTIYDAFDYIHSKRRPTKPKAALIIVGVLDHAVNSPITADWIKKMRTDGYQVLSVGVGPYHGNLAPLADKPEWYFTVDDTNGQDVADKITKILCNL